MLKRQRILLIIIVIVAVVIIALPFLYEQRITGFGAFGVPSDPSYEREKTLWSWMELLIVPVILALSAYWFSNQTQKRLRQTEEDRFREEALQKYFDNITNLLLETTATDKRLRDSARAVATLRTVTVLRRLDRHRIQEVINFLRDLQLLNDDLSILSGARLTELKLSDLDLSDVNLQRANFAGSNLSGADLRISSLIEAQLTLVNLSRANLNATDLSDADLSGADLSEAFLSDANLRGAKLARVIFSETTTLPDGSAWSDTIDMDRFTDPEHKDFWLKT
jgi:uncharacterized protein YjbI with pentapeptide repeats